MGRKKVLEKRMARLMKRKKALTERALASQDANEVRAINEQIADINDDIEEVQDELDAIEEEEKGGDPTSTSTGEGTEPTPAPAPVEGRSAAPTMVGLTNPLATFSNVQTPSANVGEQRSYLDSLEYRQAFANYVRTGDVSGFANVQMEQRDASLTTTADIGKIIPNTIMQEFIKELKVYGNIYNRVRKLNVQGGVEFPLEDLVANVTWITETTVSEEQKGPDIKTSISFGYHICEARIAQSLLSQVVSLSYLESEIAKMLAEAFIKEFDRMIISGSGSGQPLGILNDTRIPDKQKIKFTATDLQDWTSWRKKLFAVIPLAYRGQGVLVMTANTWETYIMTLKDANNNPLYAETYNPVSGLLECRFAGREVILVEPDILKDFDTASTGDCWCLYFKPNDYAINSNLQIGFKRYFNDDTNKWVNKGLTILDGKMLDTHSAYILTK